MDIKEFLLHLRQAIIDVSLEEDKLLADIADKGIFFVPEIALVYLIGRKVSENCLQMNTKLEWNKEEKLSDDYGFADLVFRGSDIGTVVIEFKKSATIDAYIDDVRKLQKLDSKYVKIFCILADVFQMELENDPRINRLEEIFINEIHRIEDFFCFQTGYSNYHKTVNCLIGVWEVK